METVSVQVGKEARKVQAKSLKTLENLMDKIGISPEEYICIVNGSVVTEKEKFSGSDKIKFVKVWSGG